MPDALLSRLQRIDAAHAAFRDALDRHTLTEETALLWVSARPSS
jgi:hypothetical protein